MEFPGSRCPKKNTTKRRLNVHLFKVHKLGSRKAANYSCRDCLKQFIRCDNDLRNLREAHNSTKPNKCVYCDIVLGNLKELQNHVADHHSLQNFNTDPESIELKISTKQQAAKKFFQSFKGS